MTRPWHLARPELVAEIERDLDVHYPTLRLEISGEEAVVRGTIPIKAPNGRVLDRWAVSVELLRDYPRDLPVVREVGHRIPWGVPDLHMEKDGRACVLLPDQRFEVFPEGAPFLDFLNGPVLSFFLFQSLAAIGEKWKYGEWAHGMDGVIEFYQKLLRTDDENITRRYIDTLARDFKGHWDCPCGSGLHIRDCHADRLQDLRHKIPIYVIRSTLKRVGQLPPKKSRRTR